MLLELRAENYAVIDQAVASFGPGLNLLTGETGAGKSILIDALALLLGGKASSDVVRHGAEKAVLGCVFEGTQGAAAILEANGIDAGAFSDDILLRREIAAGGKGRVFVNNQPATVAVLRELAPELGLARFAGRDAGVVRPGAAAGAAEPLRRDRRRRTWLRRMRPGVRRPSGLGSYRYRSRTGCEWPICGDFKRGRLPTRSLRPRTRTRSWRRRSAFWPMQRSCTRRRRRRTSCCMSRRARPRRR